MLYRREDCITWKGFTEDGRLELTVGVSYKHGFLTGCHIMLFSQKTQESLQFVLFWIKWIF